MCIHIQKNIIITRLYIPNSSLKYILYWIINFGKLARVFPLTNLYRRGQRTSGWERAVGGAQYQIVKRLPLTVKRMPSEESTVRRHAEIAVLVAAGNRIDYLTVVTGIEILSDHGEHRCTDGDILDDIGGMRSSLEDGSVVVQVDDVTIDSYGGR